MDNLQELLDAIQAAHDAICDEQEEEYEYNPGLPPADRILKAVRRYFELKNYEEIWADEDNMVIATIDPEEEAIYINKILASKDGFLEDWFEKTEFESYLSKVIQCTDKNYMVVPCVVNMWIVSNDRAAIRHCIRYEFPKER